eukprot:scaffold133718_cov31-Tisochrysis_lutea.AAC.1
MARGTGYVQDGPIQSVPSTVKDKSRSPIKALSTARKVAAGCRPHRRVDAPSSSSSSLYGPSFLHPQRGRREG